jgi:hypothetical protein
MTRLPRQQPGALGAVFGVQTETRFSGTILLVIQHRPKDYAFRRGRFHEACPDGDEFVCKGLKFL